MIGPYEKPKTRLPGGGGAPEIASHCREIYITMAQNRRAFVDKLDFITSLGHGTGGDHRARLGLKTQGPTRLLTDLCIFAPDPVTREMIVISIHAGVTREQIAANTGWEVQYAADAGVTPPPTREELQVLRELHERARAAHA